MARYATEDVVVIDLEGVATGAGSLHDPFLGVFDAACNLLALNDDGGFSLNSRLSLVIPDDGEFVVGVTRCCDAEFIEGGVGSYRLSLKPLLRAGSIGGTLVDAETGDPLSGASPPFAFVQLLRCDGVNCFEFIAYQTPDDDGHFSFANTYWEEPLTTGTYQIQAFAHGYETLLTEPFEIGEDENLDIGELPLTPLPIQFGAVTACEIAEGGTCRYAIELRARVARRFRGGAWSLVQYYPNQPSARSSTFQVGRTGTINPTPEKLNLKPGQPELLEFEFKVPQTVPEGSLICASVQIGAGETPLFNLIGEQHLFCAWKQAGILELMPDKAARRALRERKQTLMH